MCNYQGCEFGAGTYPDSVCIDGRLFDADNCDDEGGVYDNDEYIPCPICRHDDAIDWWAERNSGFIDEPADDDAAHDRKARENATLLVDDIRRNRGIEPTSVLENQS